MSRHPLNGAVYLIGVMLSISGIYALLGSPFLGVIQILVYAGAIMMLVVFVIMVLNQAQDHLVPRFDRFSIIGALMPLALLGAVVQALNAQPMTVDPNTVRGDISAIAPAMFDLSAIPGHDGHGYYLLFELIGVLLLVAVVAAVMLAKRTLESTETPGDAMAEAHGASHDGH